MSSVLPTTHLAPATSDSNSCDWLCNADSFLDLNTPYLTLPDVINHFTPSSTDSYPILGVLVDLALTYDVLIIALPIRVGVS